MAESNRAVTSLQDIDDAWLAAALGTEATPTVQQRSIGTGQVGENVRFELGWPSGSTGHGGSTLPTSVVGKFPSLDETSRATAAATGSYVKEVGFYRDLQTAVSIRTPHLHRLEEDLAENAFLLLMEDISPAEQGDQIAGCSVEEAALAVSAIAGLHGPVWGVPPVGLDWLPPRTAERGSELGGLYGMLVPGFVERYADRLTPDVRDLAVGFAERLPQWFTSFRTPHTLVHGDYRLDNLLFGTSPAAPPITVVDWQTVSVGHGPADVAYFVGAGLLPDLRRAVERDLFGRYVAELDAHGVATAPLLGDLWHDYRLGSASGLVMAVIASMIVGQTDRGDEMFCVMAERHADQMASLEMLSLIDRP